MAKSLVHNVSQAPITLPPPYIGIIPPGVAVVIDQPTSVVIAALYTVPEVARLLTVSETPNASPTTIRVSTTSAAEATEAVLAEITAPLDLNGQRAVNAGTPVAASDLATKAYVDANSGSGLTTADLGLVNAPGGPYLGIPAGSPVAVINGTVVLASASSTTTAPCSGIYTGATTNQIRTSGKQDGLVGLPADSRLYLKTGGGLSATPPLVVPGHVAQAVGYSIGTTTLFVQLEDAIVYS